MATMKKAPKAQLGKLIKKGVKAATNPASKVSKLDYSDQKSRDFQREFLKLYPEKIKKLPNGNNKIDKVKKAKPEYDKNGLEILKDKNGGSVPKAKNGKPVKKAFLGSLLGGGGGKEGGGGGMLGGLLGKNGKSVKKAQNGTPIKKFKSAEEAGAAGFKKDTTGKWIKFKKAQYGGKAASMVPPKKASIGALLPLAMKALPMVAGMLGGKKNKNGGSTKKCKYGCK
jgi:hypothetical protein